MERIYELKKAFSLRTEISAEEYYEAQKGMSEEAFALHYLREVETDPGTGTEKSRFFHLDFLAEDAKLLLLDEIRKNTADSRRYLKYIWTFIVVNICIVAAIFLISVMY